MFPEHIEAQYRYPLRGKIQPRVMGQSRRSIEDYEKEGPFAGGRLNTK
jgi:hypothetical protein